MSCSGRCYRDLTQRAGRFEPVPTLQRREAHAGVVDGPGRIDSSSTKPARGAVSREVAGAGVMDRKLIAEYEREHRATRYGATAHKSLPDILPHILAVSPKSIIDYGCGQSDLIFVLKRRMNLERIWRFDPAIPSLLEKPAGRFDLLVSIDVLEHVPDAEIDAVAAEMASLAKDVVLVIDTGPATLLLSDGTNAHVSQHDGAWWLKRLRPHFPKLRPIPGRRKRRVAFKTFDDELPLMVQHYVVSREILLKLARRFRERIWDRKIRRIKYDKGLPERTNQS